MKKLYFLFLIMCIAGTSFGQKVYNDAGDEIVPLKSRSTLKSVKTTSVSQSSSPAITTTFAGGNGQSGNMFDLTTFDKSILVEALDLNLRETSGFTVDVYIKVGTYVGAETNSLEWLKVASATGVGAGSGVPTFVDVPDFEIPASSVTGVYIVVDEGALDNNYFNYTDGINTYQNSDLQLDLGVGVYGLFGGIFSPRTWNGTIYYSTNQCIDNIAQGNDSGKEGAIVTYDQPASWAGATVTQIDDSGLTSGDFFPTGTTTQSYELVWDGGVPPAVVVEKSAKILAPTDTCTFTVTINDTEAPVAKCNTIDIVLDSLGYYELTAADIFLLTRRTSDNATAFEDLIFEVTKYTEFEIDTIQSYGPIDVGELTNLYVSVTDESGNESVCGVLLNVKDTFPVILDNVENIEIELEAGICDTVIDYPVLSASRETVVFELIDGLGPDGVFPVGTTTEIWEASNNNGFVDTLSFDVIVSGANIMPTMDSIADVDADEDAAVSVALTGISGGMDCVLQDVTLTATGVNVALVSSIAVNYVAGDSTATVDLILAADQAGSDTITVVVEDSEGAQISQMFVLMVEPVNDAPVLLEPIASILIAANDSLEFNISKVQGEMFDDVDDDSLAYSVSVAGDTLPDWITISDEADAFGVMLKPMETDSGCYSLVVSATDAAGAMVADTFAVCVDDVVGGDDAVVVGIGDMDAEKLGVKIYPNPSSGMVTVETGSALFDETEIAVVNIAGSEVFRKIYHNGESIRFNMSEQVSGMYMVFIQQNDQRVVKKLILDKR